MAFRLRTIETTADGRRIVRDQELGGDQVTIGRSAECTLHLPDLALDPHHATITQRGAGRIGIEAAGTLGCLLDGKQITQAEIDPQSGGELRLGSFRLALSADADGAVLLTLGKADVAAHDLEEKSAFSLAAHLPGKRGMAWLLALAIAIGFLALPIFSYMVRDAAPGKHGVVGDAAWSTGPLSQAHRQLESKCTACHVKPFEAVRNETCQSCHKDLHDHAPVDRLASARGAGGVGDQAQWAAAHAFGKPGPGACSDCHTEHEGGGKMAAPAQAFCADCHGGLKDRLPDTRIEDAADFGTEHPEFRPALALTTGSSGLSRVSLARHPREASGLTFPHRLHLDKRGGVARMAAQIGGAKGYGPKSTGADGMACKDCHRPTADGVRFLPITMERDCASCHSLAYDKVGSTFRRLRHGDVDQMIADLSVAPRTARPIASGRQRPGQYANGGAYFARFSPADQGGSQRAGQNVGAVAQALSRDGICGECHVPAMAGGRFSVMPVTQVTRYLNHGWFTHAAHKQEKCTSCHAAERSSSSADLLLPDLKSCRTCHAGEDAPATRLFAGTKVSSGCAMCHNYHITAQAPRGVTPDRKP